MQREACFQGVRTALRSASLGGKSDFGATFPWGSLSMGELSLYNTGMVRQTWVWEFDISLYYTVKATSVQKRSLVSFLVRQSQKIRYQEYLHILTLRPRVSRFILITMPVMIHPKDTNIQRVVGFCRSKICHVLRLRFSIFEVFSDDKNNFF